VFVADDHPMFLTAVADAIGEYAGLELVGATTNGHDAVTAIPELEPHVAVLDMRLRGVSGQEVLRAVSARSPRVRVLFLSAHIESELIYAALAGGAAGYLSKETDREAICAAIVAVAGGEIVLSSDVQRQIAGAIRDRDAHEHLVLTPREHAVLALAAEGLSTREIGARLEVASATVKTHLHSVYHKLDATDRTSAVAAAMRRGMLG
jgi:two-component system nitrate/nitrite response regulator NarL